MTRFCFVACATALLLALGSWPPTAPAQEETGAAPASEAAEGAPANETAPAGPAPSVGLDARTRGILRTLAAAGKMPIELRDPAFDRYVDLALLGTAWADLDPSLMTDVAFQLIEGERVLLRPHRVISTDDLLRVAIRLAAVKRDATTLGRLETAIKPRGNAGLLAQLSEAQKALAEAKPEDPAMIVSVDALTADAFQYYKGCLKDIDAALVANDGGALTQIEKELAGMTLLPAEYQTKLQERVATTKARLSGPEQPAAQVAGILNKLAGAARNPFPDTPTVPGPPDNPPPEIPPTDDPPPSSPPPEGPPPGWPPPEGPPPGWPPPEGPPPGWPPPEGPPPGWPPSGPPSYPPSYPPQQQQQQWIPPKAPVPRKYSPPGKYTPPTKYPPSQQSTYYPYPQPDNGYPQPDDGQGPVSFGYPRRYSSGR